MAGTLSLNRRVLAAEQRMSSSDGSESHGVTGTNPQRNDTDGGIGNEDAFKDWASSSMALMASPTAAVRASAVGETNVSNLREAPLESVDHDSSVNGGAVSSPPPLIHTATSRVCTIVA